MADTNPSPLTPRAIVHIGTDRAGATSFQTWASSALAAIEPVGRYGYYAGRFGSNHIELSMATMRPDRNSDCRVDEYDWCLEAWQADTRRHAAEQVAQPAEVLVASAQSLSLVRHEDEVQRLVELLAPRPVSVVVALREPKAYLRSRARDLVSRGFYPSRYVGSFAYVETGSWVCDYDALLAPYRAVLGADQVHVVDYDESTRRWGSVIPALAEPLGLSVDQLRDWQGLDEGASPPSGLIPAPRLGLRATQARYAVGHPAETARKVWARARPVHETPAPVARSTRPRRAIVHIGTHKTGTTSFQNWGLRNGRSLSAAIGLRYYNGKFHPNHVEFPILAMRPDRNSNHRVIHFDWCMDRWQHELREHIQGEVAAEADTLLVSAEALDFLRHEDEVEALRDLLAPREVGIVAVFREREAFLRSWRGELAKAAWRPSPYPDSFAYAGPDAFVADYDAMLRPHRAVFGDDRVHTVSYEDAVARFGSTTPAILEPFGYSPDELGDWDAPWKNVTPDGDNLPNAKWGPRDHARVALMPTKGSAQQ